jgi:hypothetical protein
MVTEVLFDKILPHFPPRLVDRLGAYIHIQIGHRPRPLFLRFGDCVAFLMDRAR